MNDLALSLSSTKGDKLCGEKQKIREEKHLFLFFITGVKETIFPLQNKDFFDKILPSLIRSKISYFSEKEESVL